MTVVVRVGGSRDRLGDGTYHNHLRRDISGRAPAGSTVLRLLLLSAVLFLFLVGLFLVR